jgi:hypothetical protein
MHTTNHVSEHDLQCASWYPVHSTLNVGLKLLQCVCVDDLNTQYPWDAPIKTSLGGLSPRIAEATVSLKLGVQETQIPSKPWVAWFFEHPVEGGWRTYATRSQSDTREDVPDNAAFSAVPVLFSTKLAILWRFYILYTGAEVVYDYDYEQMKLRGFFCIDQNPWQVIGCLNRFPKDFKFSRRRVWSSELSSGMYYREKQLSTDVSEVRAAYLWNIGRQLFYTAVHPRRQFWTGFLKMLSNILFSLSV